MGVDGVKEAAGPPRLKSRHSSFLVLENDERHDASYGEYDIPRHIGELPRKLVEIMKSHRARINSVFDSLDENNDGSVSLPEFTRAIKLLGVAEAASDADVRRLFHAIDTDHDGTITFDELVAMCKAASSGKEVLKISDEERQRRDEAVAAAKRAAEEAAAAAAAAEDARLQRELLEKEAHELAERRQREREAAAEERRRRQLERQHQQAAAAALKLQKERERMERLRELAAAMENSRGRKPLSLAWAPSAEWNKYAGPRVERAGKRSLHYRARPDNRPASVAFPGPKELTLFARSSSAATLAPTSSTASLHARLERHGSHASLQATAATLSHPLHSGVYASTMPRIPPAYGSKRNILLVARLGPNQYTFSLPSSTYTRQREPLSPGRDSVRDDDLVDTVVAKLHEVYPREVPLEVPWSAGSGAPELMRRVQTVLICEGVVLDGGRSLAPQCREACFNKKRAPAARAASRAQLQTGARPSLAEATNRSDTGLRQGVPGAVPSIAAPSHRQPPSFRGSMPTPAVPRGMHRPRSAPVLHMHKTSC